MEHEKTKDSVTDNTPIPQEIKGIDIGNNHEELLEMLNDMRL